MYPLVRDLGYKVEGFLNTLVAKVSPRLEFRVICVTIKAEDIERLFRGDRDQVS